ADQVVGLMLLHDTQVVSAGGWGGIAAENRAVWHCDKAVIRDHEAIRRYDLYSPGYRFLPYWRQNAATGLKDRQFVSWFIRQPIQMGPEAATRNYWQYWTREETDTNLPHRAIGIFCNESDWKGEMAVKVDLKKLGFTHGAKIKAINAVHSTGYRIENAGTPQENGAFYPKPEETATIRGDEVRFPMTEWNYRMIVIEEER
ncbi:MAG: hypothetical protein PHR35_09695, partial [Kiritimatiellae bacterium]|nr:hypothetical protein [Kiritimatiellia bacterium]